MFINEFSSTTVEDVHWISVGISKRFRTVVFPLQSSLFPPFSLNLMGDLVTSLSLVLCVFVWKMMSISIHRQYAIVRRELGRDAPVRAKCSWALDARMLVVCNGNGKIFSTSSQIVFEH